MPVCNVTIQTDCLKITDGRLECSLALTDSRFVPNSDFWHFWHQDKENLKSHGIRVFKDPSRWYGRVLTHKLRDRLADAMEQWQKWLVGCCVDFSEMQILRKTQKNGRLQYQLFCPHCQKSKTSFLPYVLAEHLMKEKGLAPVKPLKSGVSHG